MNKKILTIFLISITNFWVCSISAQTGMSTIYYMSSDSLFPNPERGFSKHRDFKVTVGLAQNLRQNNITVIQRIYNIPDFRSDSLSTEFLEKVETDFNNAREGGAKLVPRFSYTNDQNGPDAPLEIVLKHIAQLKPLFQKHADIIAYLEAGFIGAWGEWYYSTNNLNNTEDRRTVLFALLDALPQNRCVAVRTPDYKRKIFDISVPLNKGTAFNGSNIARTGAHNDCFLASATDYGTYLSNDIEGDKDYLNQDNRFVPQGGETCTTSAYSGCVNALADLERMHWSVLNQDYNTDVLNSWEADGCMDEVKQRLGYRFSLLSAQISDSLKPGGVYKHTFNLFNEGFASPYNPRNLEIILRNIESGIKYYFLTEDDPRFWVAGDTSTISIEAGIPADIQQGTYEVMLHLADPQAQLHDRPEYAIRLANENVWEDSTGYNSFLHSIEITSEATGEAYSGNSFFLAQKPTGITMENNSPEIFPNDLQLLGNFPNPFNSSTHINFMLKNPGRVGIDIFNMHGRLVQKLFYDYLNQGRHSISWDAGELSSGMYFYKIRVNGLILTGKSILIK